MLRFIKVARELQNREMQILLLALTLGTTAITAPALLAERLGSGVRLYSENVLGGDATVTSPTPLAAENLAAATSRGLQVSRKVSLSSIAVNPANEQFSLTRLRAVAANFPLKGNLLATTDLTTPESLERSSAPPRAGEIWLEELLAQVLGVQLGDEVQLGEASFTFTKYFIAEPGRASFFSFAPRAMISLQDLAATGVALPGGRVRHTILWSGESEVLAAYLAELEPQLQESQRLLRAADEDTNFTDILRRLRVFLLLSGSLCIFLSSFALLLSLRHFIERNRRHVALVKTFGYTPRRTLLYLCRRLLPLALLGFALGCLGGWLCYSLAAFYLDKLLPPAAAGFSAQPFIISGISALICLLTFALPALVQLAAQPPLYLLRPAAGGWLAHSQLITIILACLGIFVLLLFYTGDLVISAALLGAVCGIMLVLGLLGLGLTKLLYSRARTANVPVSLKIALIALYRFWPLNSLQILSFAAAFMLLGVLSIIRVSFINDWQGNLEPDTPNYFIVNIAPTEAAGLQQLLTENGVTSGIFAGAVRAKLARVAGEDLRARTERLGTYDEEVEEEMNLSWTNVLPEYEQLAAGQWWDEPLAQEISAGVYPVSIEEDLAAEFGIELGMQLEFVSGSRTIYGVATNLRRVDWSTFKPSFYVLFPDGALADFPQSYITSFYLPAAQKELLGQVVREFPTFSIISVERILAQLQELLQVVANAMQLILMLSLLAALAVFIAAIQVSIDARQRATAMLRLIGETTRQALNHNLLEFVFIGLLAGILAVIGSEVVVWLVYENLLEQEFSPHYYFWLICPLVSTGLAALIGAVWAWRAIRLPPRSVMRTLGL